MNNVDIKSLTIEEIEQIIIKLKQPRFRAKQLFDWIHVKKISNYREMKNIPYALIDILMIDYPLIALNEVSKLEDNKDGTVKYLFELKDKQLVETVLMKYKYGYSICISSQVGCKMGCTFCASTIGGLKRQLLPSEMLDQIYVIERKMDIQIHSVVVMGTGEPLDNYDNLIRFIKLLSHEKGRHLSRRNITVSTCGIIDNINRIAIDVPQINLAISLHSPYNDKRKEIMPITIKYPLNNLIQACSDYTKKTGRRITFEYSLINGVNDDIEHGKDLAKLLKGMLCHVNLIPINSVDERDYLAADKGHILRFKEVLDKEKIPTTIRRSLGQNIDAACGQLRNRHLKDQK